MDDEYKNYLTEIVLKLTGRLDFAGESSLDYEAFNNINYAEPMLYELIQILADNAKNKDRAEYSIQKIGKTSYDILKEIQRVINSID